MSSPHAGPPERNAEPGLVLFAAVIGAVTLTSQWPHHNLALGIAQALTGAAACLSLLAWHRWPMPVAMFTTIVTAFSPVAVGAAVLAIVNAAVRCGRRSYILLSAFVIAVAAIHAALYLEHAAYLTNGIVAVTAVLLGFVARVRRERGEVEEQRRIEQARAAERRRIAREMHDVLAHRISMVSLHAGALEYHPDAPPEDIAKAAGVIRTSAHAALGELRQVINLLRSPADPADGDTLPPPQPTLQDVPQLVEESRQAGTSVNLDRRTEVVTVDTATGRTVYRIVQEGLTNARKHSPGSEVDVEIAGTATRSLTVCVLTRPSRTENPAPPPPGSGTGLIGLAERVALSGGRLEHGPTPDGGYALKATLPLAT